MHRCQRGGISIVWGTSVRDMPVAAPSESLCCSFVYSILPAMNGQKLVSSDRIGKRSLCISYLSEHHIPHVSFVPIVSV